CRCLVCSSPALLECCSCTCPDSFTSRCSYIPSLFFSMTPRPPSSTLFPYTTLFRSCLASASRNAWNSLRPEFWSARKRLAKLPRSEEHTSELQSHLNLVCRLLLEKKKKTMRSLHRDERRKEEKAPQRQRTHEHASRA